MTALYALWRLPALTRLPPFTDEICFVRWAQLLHRDFANNAFIAYTGAGKQSLNVWLGSLFYPLFDDPVFGLRLYAFLAGLLALWGAMRLARAFAPDHPLTAPLATGLLYIVMPFMVWHERQFIAEPLIGALNVWSFVLIWEYLREPHRRVALLYGLVLGLGLITKTYCLYFVCFPALLVVENRLREGRWPAKRQWLGLAGAFFLAATIYIAANLYPRLALSEVNALKFSDYMNFSPAAIAGQARVNLPRLTEIYRINFGLPMLALFVAYGIVAARRRAPGWLALPLLVGGVIVMPLLFSKYIFSRYISISAPYLVLGAALSLVALYDYLWSVRGPRPAAIAWTAGLLVLTASLAPTGWTMMRDPLHARLDSMDRWQYVTGWPSGYGLRESLNYLREETAGEERVDVFFNHNLRGMPFNGYEQYFDTDENIRLHMIFWERQVPVLDFVARNYPTYVYRTNNHHGRELLRPEHIRRAFYVGNVSLMNMKNFIALNDEPKKFRLFYRPEEKSALLVFELTVPVVGDGGPAPSTPLPPGAGG